MNSSNERMYTWHHHQIAGKMQLVDANIHAKTGHSGGRSIWGFGRAGRTGRGGTDE
nr:HNH endonuclease [Paenibacillus allorhizoplanae]